MDKCGPFQNVQLEFLILSTHQNIFVLFLIIVQTDFRMNENLMDFF